MKVTYTAIIIDDEKININLLSKLINRCCPDIEIVATASNFENGIEAILQHKPALLYLDIEIHGKTGFDLLKCVDTSNMCVIMVKGYEKYAIQAIKSWVSDYILKPVQINDLIEATNKCIAQIQQKLAQNQVKEDPNLYTDFISIHHKDHIEIVKLEDIIQLESIGGCTQIHIIPDKMYTSSKSLKFYEKQLPPHIFLRTHNSYIVNIHHIVKYLKGRYGTLLMINDIEIPISLPKKKEVSDRLGLHL